MVTADRVLDVIRSELADLIHHAEAGDLSLTPKAPVDNRKRLVERRSRAIDRIGELSAKLAVGDFTGSREQAARSEIATLEAIVAEAEVVLAKSAPSMPSRGDILSKVKHLVEHWDDDSVTVTDRNAALRQVLTVYVQRRPEGAAFRMPYADRLSFRWAWESAAA